MIDSTHVNVCHYDQNNTVQFLIVSGIVTTCYIVLLCDVLSLANRVVRFLLTAGSSAGDKSQAEAKCPRPRPKL